MNAGIVNASAAMTVAGTTRAGRKEINRRQASRSGKEFMILTIKNQHANNDKKFKKKLTHANAGRQR